MRKILFSLLLLTSCGSGQRVTTMESFYEIPIGASKNEVIAQAGEPMTSRRLEDGDEEFVYVERLTASNRVLQERRYILILRDGKVFSRRVEYVAPPSTSTTFDSYQMQTTQNQ